MFSRIGAAAYKADLTNTILLCNEIGNPQNSFKAIHIAGTNGKGSTSHLLAAVMQTAGYKTGLYTSPHLKDFRERIKVNGIMCDELFVVNFISKLQPLIETIKPSFFELTVAMAFEYFAQQNVDIAIIETGLGGRLDSTNIIKPIISVITNIGLDHTNLLGNTLKQIAFEKAGIIKHQTPVVVGKYLPQTKNIFLEKAAKENAAIYFAEDNYSALKYYYNHHLSTISIQRNDVGLLNDYAIDLTGMYQIDNLITVLETCYQLKKQGWHIDDEIIKNGIHQTKKLTGLYGRWQCIQENPTIILDVAHNVDGIKRILMQLTYLNYTNLRVIIGMVKDKDINGVLALLPQNATYYFTKAQIERALPEVELQNLALPYFLKGNCFTNVNLALEAAKANATTQDLILVCGSVFLIGEVE